jgi:hypothetical protein
MLRRASATLLAALVVPAPAAQAVTQTQKIWMAFSAEAVIAGPLRGQYESQVRYSEDRGGFFLAQHRFALGYRPTRPLTLWLGGQVSNSLEDERVSLTERRVMGQLDYVVATPPRRRLVARTRVERRDLEDNPEIGWRVRQRLAVDFALPRPDAVIVTHAEAMFGVNETRWGQVSGFERTRAYVGASLPVGTLAVCSSDGAQGSECRSRIRVDVGYLNQWRPRRDREDLVEHIAVVSLSIRP